jgi:hypothetical protein
MAHQSEVVPPEIGRRPRRHDEKRTARRLREEGVHAARALAPRFFVEGSSENDGISER